MAYTVKLAMITRDEERCLARALASVAPHVDGMVVVDTGSADATTSIAAGFGANVVPAPWRDDFAAARNAAIEAADADWTVILDADEWIAEGGAELERLRTLEPHWAGIVQVASSFELADRIEHQTESSVRLLPRSTRYVGRVHEQPTPIHGRKAVSLLIMHDGYESTQREVKRGRNERLLRVSLNEAPEDPYLRYQLGKDLEIQGRYAEAAAEYVRARTAETAEVWRHDLDARTIFALKKTGRFQDGIKVAEGALERWPSSPDISFALGDLLLDASLSDPQQAAGLLPLVEGAWLRCLQLGDRPELSGSVAGRGSHLAASNLAGFHEALGDEESASRFRQLSAQLRERPRPTGLPGEHHERRAFRGAKLAIGDC